MLFHQLNAAELQTGSSGPEVSQIQTWLTQWGYSPGPIDGIFGPQTKAAVQLFQSDMGLPVDGIVGPITLVTLNGTAATPSVPTPSAVPTVSPRTAPTVAIFPQGVTPSMLSGFSSTQLIIGGLALLVAVPMFLGGKKRR